MIHTLEHIVMHALKDNISIIPFLFLTYCTMEYLEQFMSEKSERAVRYFRKNGPLVGGILGIIPQCGFSAAAASLYSGGIITLGTMLAIFFSTSDEMLPILISASVPLGTIGRILGLKVLIAVLSGYAVDLIARSFCKSHTPAKRICRPQEQDHSEEDSQSVWKTALVHTLKVFGFLFLVSVALNLILESGGELVLEQIASNHSVLAVILTGMVALVPNCAASIIITQLYLKNIISAGAMMSGLLVSAGVGVLVLFKFNRPIRQNIRILALLYTIGVAAGFLIDLLSITF